MKVLTATRMLPHHGGAFKRGSGELTPGRTGCRRVQPLWRCAEQSVEHSAFSGGGVVGHAGEFLQALAHDDGCNRAVDSSGVPKMHRLTAEQA